MRRKKFIKNTLIEVDGKKVRVPIFGTTIKLGDKNMMESIDEWFEEDKIENIIKDVLKKIEKISTKYDDKKKNLKYYYEVGKILQFVDDKGYTDMRGLIWARMVHDFNPEFFDFNPELFSDEKEARRESKRHPEFMYLLGKVNKKYLSKVSWDQWYEILKFKDTYKDGNLLVQVLSECANNNLSGIPLRNKIKQLRKFAKRCK